MIKMKYRKAIGIGIVALAGALVGAVVLPQLPKGEKVAQGNHEALHYAMDHLTARQAARDEIAFDRTLAEVLPNQRFSIETANAKPLLSTVVRGKVIGVSAGAAYLDGAEEESTELPFDAPNATWRALVMKVQVDDDFDEEREAPRVVEVGLSFDGGVDAELMLRAFEGQEVLLPLEKPGFYRFDRTLYNISHSGSLLGLVSEDGSLSMPALGVNERSYLGELTSIERVSEEAERQKPVITIETRDGVPTRLG